MNTHDDNIISDLGQIVKEEAHFAYGIQRVLLGLISFGLFIGSLYCFTSPDMRGGSALLTNGQIGGGALLFFSALFAFGSWWANRIHQKLVKLNNQKESSN